MKRLMGCLFTFALVLSGTAEAAETIRGTAVRVGAGVQSSYLNVTLERYSTDEERGRWREAFAAGGQNALVAKWQKEDVSVGTLSFTGTMGYPVRAALSVATDKGRKIYLATDRPIAGIELLGGSRSEDYPIGWVEIEVNEKGKGEGQLVGAAELVVEDSRLMVKQLGTEPIHLINVTIKEKK